MDNFSTPVKNPAPADSFYSPNPNGETLYVPLRLPPALIRENNVIYRRAAPRALNFDSPELQQPDSPQVPYLVNPVLLIGMNVITPDSKKQSKHHPRQH